MAYISIDSNDVPPQPVNGRSSRYQSQVQIQPPPRPALPNKHRRDIYGRDIVSERPVSPFNGFQPLSTRSQLEMIGDDSTLRSVPNLPRSGSRASSTIRTIEPQMPVRRVPITNLTEMDDPASVRNTNGVSNGGLFLNKRKQERMTESKSMNHLKSLLASNGYKEHPPAALPHIPVRQRTQSGSNNGRSIEHVSVFSVYRLF